MQELIKLMKQYNIAELQAMVDFPDEYRNEIALLKAAVNKSCQNLLDSKAYKEACHLPSGAADVMFQQLKSVNHDLDSNLPIKFDSLSFIIHAGHAMLSSKEAEKQANYAQILSEFTQCVQSVCLDKVINEHGGYVNAINAKVKLLKGRDSKESDTLGLLLDHLVNEENFNNDTLDGILSIGLKEKLTSKEHDSLKFLLGFLTQNPNDEVFNEIEKILSKVKKRSKVVDPDMEVLLQLICAKDSIQKEIFLKKFFANGMTPKQQKEVNDLFSNCRNNYRKFLQEFLCYYAPLEEIPNYLNPSYLALSSASEDDRRAHNQPTEQEVFEADLFQFLIKNSYKIYHKQMSLQIDHLVARKTHEIEQEKLDTFPSHDKYRKTYLEQNNLQEFSPENSEYQFKNLKQRKWGSHSYRTPYREYAELGRGDSEQREESKMHLEMMNLGYQDELKTLVSAAKKEAIAALTPKINEVAKQTMLSFISFIRNYIETATWKTGLFGLTGETVTIKGKTKKLPKNVYEIYKLCKNIDEKTNVETVQNVFNKIMYLGKKADEKTFTLFRDDKTRKFYMFFRQADEGKTKYMEEKAIEARPPSSTFSV